MNRAATLKRFTLTDIKDCVTDVSQIAGLYKEGKPKACNKERRNKYYQDNKEKITAARFVNKDAINARRAELRRVKKIERKELKAKQSAGRKERRKMGYGGALSASGRRSEAIAATGQRLSKGLREKLMASQRGLCVCCGEILGENAHLDHIMPIALGGSNTDDNMQLLRQRCNNQKHAKHPVDFMQSRGFLL